LPEALTGKTANRNRQKRGGRQKSWINKMNYPEGFIEWAPQKADWKKRHLLER